MIYGYILCCRKETCVGHAITRQNMDEVHDDCGCVGEDKALNHVRVHPSNFVGMAKMNRAVAQTLGRCPGRYMRKQRGFSLEERKGLLYDGMMLLRLSHPENPEYMEELALMFKMDNCMTYKEMVQSAPTLLWDVFRKLILLEEGVNPHHVLDFAESLSDEEEEEEEEVKIVSRIQAIGSRLPALDMDMIREHARNHHETPETPTVRLSETGSPVIPPAPKKDKGKGKRKAEIDLRSPVVKRRTGSKKNPCIVYETESEEEIPDSGEETETEVVEETDLDEEEEEDFALEVGEGDPLGEGEWVLDYPETCLEMSRMKKALDKPMSIVRKMLMLREYSSLKAHWKRLRIELGFDVDGGYERLQMLMSRGPCRLSQREIVEYRKTLLEDMEYADIGRRGLLCKLYDWVSDSLNLSGF